MQQWQQGLSLKRGQPDRGYDRPVQRRAVRRTDSPILSRRRGRPLAAVVSEQRRRVHAERYEEIFSKLWLPRAVAAQSGKVPYTTQRKSRTLLERRNGPNERGFRFSGPRRTLTLGSSPGEKSRQSQHNNRSPHRCLSLFSKMRGVPLAHTPPRAEFPSCRATSCGGVTLPWGSLSRPRYALRAGDTVGVDYRAAEGCESVCVVDGCVPVSPRQRVCISGCCHIRVYAA